MRISDWSSDVCSSDLDHRDALAAQQGALPSQTAIYMATACACLIGGEAIATQFLRPIRGEETMSRAGHGVLVYARSGCENAADDIGFVTGGGRDDKNIAHVPEHSEKIGRAHV